MHTPFCRHAVGAPTEYAAEAVRAGLTEIGFTEHAPMITDDFDDWHMFYGDLDAYVDGVGKATADHPELNIRIGLEIDYIPGHEDWIRQLASHHPWDYLVGSVHYLGEKWGFDHPDHVDSWEGRDLMAVWAEYFERQTQAAALGVFDIIGHCDLVKKFGHRPDGDCIELARPFLEEVKRKDSAIEINTCGLRVPAAELFPGDPILAMAAETGVGLTFGSDAHAPKNVGYNFALAVTAARRAGFTHGRRFAGREFEAVAF